MPFPTSSIALFCEDIRDETAGSHTLVGVLPDNMHTPTKPIDSSASPKKSASGLGKLLIYVRTQIDTGLSIFHAEMHLVQPDGSRLLMDSFTKDAILNAQSEASIRKLPICTVVTRIQIAPFLLPPPGIMTVEATINSDKFICGQLNFVLDPTVN